MNVKNNRRAKMTKEMLKESLLELMRTTPLPKISIRTLCEHADINRSTFYKYYGSQYDLFHAIEDDLLLRIDETLATLDQDPADNSAPLISLLDYLKENLEICQLLMTSDVDPEFPKKLLFRTSIQSTINESLSKYSKTMDLYLREYLLAGEFRIIHQWLQRDCKESSESIVKLLISLGNATINPSFDIDVFT
ncbi:TetR/AcrR family transcriptional regulator [Eubacterium oxidoreducens]|uniref:Transcriptional regulator, TetR family n=1 Tax=Eubacterium oxidoreducens TaxID=1732 RepID=A0A1G6AVH8_EUBOX|nr:TetR/AcrR family transcriptional regulator [Eubacterium oxidoreducens]SDB12273.1 transcriptional regulator, TetR family [Eubacterium oxidoreducens]